MKYDPLKKSFDMTDHRKGSIAKMPKLFETEKMGHLLHLDKGSMTGRGPARENELSEFFKKNEEYLLKEIVKEPQKFGRAEKGKDRKSVV